MTYVAGILKAVALTGVGAVVLLTAVAFITVMVARLIRARSDRGGHSPASWMTGPCGPVRGRRWRSAPVARGVVG